MHSICLQRITSGYLFNNEEANIISHLREIWAMFGAPMSILSDNGSNFVSEEMQRFLIKWGIQNCFTRHKANQYELYTNVFPFLFY